jgi:hypothetical protein
VLHFIWFPLILNENDEIWKSVSSQFFLGESRWIWNIILFPHYPILEIILMCLGTEIVVLSETASYLDGWFNFLKGIFYCSITYMQRSAQIISVDIDDYLKRKHTCVTKSQSRKWPLPARPANQNPAPSPTISQFISI